MDTVTRTEVMMIESKNLDVTYISGVCHGNVLHSNAGLDWRTLSDNVLFFSGSVMLLWI